MLWLDTNLYSGSWLQLDVTRVRLTSEDGSEEKEYTVANNGLQEPGSIWGYRDAWDIKNYAATVKNPYMSYRYFLKSDYDNYKPEYSNYLDRINETIDLFKGKKISIASGSTITVDFMVKANPDVTASPAPSVSPSSEPLVSETPAVSPSSEPLVSETPSASPEPTKDPDEFQINPQDVAALKELINEQRSKGAKVDESIYSMEYGWNMDGRLIEINWPEKTLYGDISLSGLPYLEVFYCGDGNLTSVDVTGNSYLKELFVGYNQLTSIDVSQNADLQMLSVAKNQLTSLDTSNNLQLDTLWCQGNQLDIVYVNQTISESNIYKDSTTKIVRKSPGEVPTAQPTSSAKPTAEPTIAPTMPPESTATAQPTNTPEVTKDPGSKPSETNPPEASEKPGDKPDVTSSPDASVRPSGQPDTSQPSDKPGNTSTTSPNPQVTLTPASTTRPDGQGTNPVSATAQPEPKGSVLTVGNGIYKVISGDGEEPSVIYWLTDSKTASQIVIPDTVESKGVRYKVTSIAKGAFENNKKLKSIVIGKNIVSIGKNAFKNCKNLKKIVIRSEKLKASKVGANMLKGTHKKLVIKVPKNKQKQYKKFLKKRGNKKVRITK